MFSSVGPRLAQTGDSRKPALPNSTAQARDLPSTTIHDLPIELLVEIVGYISEPHDRYSLCLASKPLNSAATACLYHSISVGRDALRLQELVRTLSESPALAMHIKSVHLHLPNDVSDVTPAQSELNGFLEAIRPLTPHDSRFHHKLANALRHGYYDGNAILLLLLATQVDELHLIPDGGHAAFRQSHAHPCSSQQFTDLIRALIVWAETAGPTTSVARSSSAQPSSALNNVRKLCFYSATSPEFKVRPRDLPADCCSTAFPFQYMFLPHLEDLRARGSASWQSLSPGYGQANAHITRLRLEWTSMDSKNIGLAIRTCHKLIELHIQWHDDILDPRYSDKVIDLDEIRSALNEHAATLKRLQLIFMTPEVSLELLRGDLGTLSHFSALETLRIDETSLFKSEVTRYIDLWEPLGSFQRASGFLPPNLKEFRLDSRKQPFAEIIHRVLATISAMLPANLTRLNVSFEFNYWKELHQHIECCQWLSFHPSIGGSTCGGGFDVPYSRMLIVTVQHKDGVLVGLREALATNLMKAIRIGLEDEEVDDSDDDDSDEE
ncbi:hypothetical protein CBER1_02283 [Cercospora berteroae]|uniref:F-box domain-containing protein n=1 Tax=Cercospora berteroae TaxID=357750 RepID=A0A2S6CB38_9PEZI|nr:hypothetical protein CBER1_02283 [Cercospora berteroae]